MYILSPSRESKEVKEFISKWNLNDQKLFTGPSGTEFTFPLQNLISICALLIWQPANPNDTITRILFPGSTPQNKIFEGLETFRHLEFIKHPVCTACTISPSTSSIGLSNRTAGIKLRPQPQVIDKITSSDINKETNKVENKILKTTPIASTVTKGIAPKEENQSIMKQTKKIQEKTKIELKKVEKPQDKTKIEKKTETKHKIEAPKKKTDVLKSKFKETKSIHKSVEKKSDVKSSPTTPKKVSAITKSEKVTPKTKESLKIGKPSPTSTPAKSTKDATNRKVVESKMTRSAKYSPPQGKKPISKKDNIERKIVPNRKLKIGSPTKTDIGSPIKSATIQGPPKTSSNKSKKESIDSKSKHDIDKIADSSAVSTPSTVDPETLLKGKEETALEEMKEESSDKEVSLKNEDLESKEDEDDVNEIQSKKIISSEKPKPKEKFSLTKGESEEKEEDEYLIIEKEETEEDNELDESTHHSLESYIHPEEVDDIEENEIKKHRDETESEKNKLDKPLDDEEDYEKDNFSRENKEKELSQEIQENKQEIEKPLDSKEEKFEDFSSPEKKLVESEEKKTEESATPEEKVDNSLEKKESTEDREISQDQKIEEPKTGSKEIIEQKNQQEESHLEEKFSTTVESAATTAPTLPEDERIPLDEIKEIVEEKYVKEETKEKEKQEEQMPITAKVEQPTTLPQVVVPGGIFNTHIVNQRDIVKTPDEVADLPVHEEVDPGLYRTDDDERELKKEPSLEKSEHQKLEEKIKLDKKESKEKLEYEIKTKTELDLYEKEKKEDEQDDEKHQIDEKEVIEKVIEMKVELNLKEKTQSEEDDKDKLEFSGNIIEKEAEEIIKEISMKEEKSNLDALSEKEQEDEKISGDKVENDFKKEFAKDHEKIDKEEYIVMNDKEIKSDINIKDEVLKEKYIFDDDRITTNLQNEDQSVEISDLKEEKKKQDEKDIKESEETPIIHTTDNLKKEIDIAKMHCEEDKFETSEEKVHTGKDDVQLSSKYIRDKDEILVDENIFKDITEDISARNKQEKEKHEIEEVKDGNIVNLSKTIEDKISEEEKIEHFKEEEKEEDKKYEYIEMNKQLKEMESIMEKEKLDFLDITEKNKETESMKKIEKDENIEKDETVVDVVPKEIIDEKEGIVKSDETELIEDKEVLEKSITIIQDKEKGGEGSEKQQIYKKDEIIVKKEETKLKEIDVEIFKDDIDFDEKAHKLPLDDLKDIKVDDLLDKEKTIKKEKSIQIHEKNIDSKEKYQPQDILEKENKEPFDIQNLQDGTDDLKKAVDEGKETTSKEKDLKETYYEDLDKDEKEKYKGEHYPEKIIHQEMNLQDELKFSSLEEKPKDLFVDSNKEDTGIEKQDKDIEQDVKELAKEVVDKVEEDAKKIVEEQSITKDSTSQPQPQEIKKVLIGSSHNDKTNELLTYLAIDECILSEIEKPTKEQDEKIEINEKIKELEIEHHSVEGSKILDSLDTDIGKDAEKDDIGETVKDSEAEVEKIIDTQVSDIEKEDSVKSAKDIVEQHISSEDKKILDSEDIDIEKDNVVKSIKDTADQHISEKVAGLVDTQDIHFKEGVGKDDTVKSAIDTADQPFSGEVEKILDLQDIDIGKDVEIDNIIIKTAKDQHITGEVKKLLDSQITEMGKYDLVKSAIDTADAHISEDDKKIIDPFEIDIEKDSEKDDIIKTDISGEDKKILDSQETDIGKDDIVKSAIDTADELISEVDKKIIDSHEIDIEKDKIDKISKSTTDQDISGEVKKILHSQETDIRKDDIVKSAVDTSDEISEDDKKIIDSYEINIEKDKIEKISKDTADQDISGENKTILDSQDTDIGKDKIEKISENTADQDISEVEKILDSQGTDVGKDRIDKASKDTADQDISEEVKIIFDSQKTDNGKDKIGKISKDTADQDISGEVKIILDSQDSDNGDKDDLIRGGKHTTVGQDASGEVKIILDSQDKKSGKYTFDHSGIKEEIIKKHSENLEIKKNDQYFQKEQSKKDEIETTSEIMEKEEYRKTYSYEESRSEDEIHFKDSTYPEQEYIETATTIFPKETRIINIHEKLTESQVHEIPPLKETHISNKEHIWETKTDENALLKPDLEEPVFAKLAPDDPEVATGSPDSDPNTPRHSSEMITSHYEIDVRPKETNIDEEIKSTIATSKVSFDTENISSQELDKDLDKKSDLFYKEVEIKQRQRKESFGQLKEDSIIYPEKIEEKDKIPGKEIEKSEGISIDETALKEYCGNEMNLENLTFNKQEDKTDETIETSFISAKIFPALEEKLQSDLIDETSEFSEKGTQLKDYKHEPMFSDVKEFEFKTSEGMDVFEKHTKSDIDEDKTIKVIEEIKEIFPKEILKSSKQEEDVDLREIYFDDLKDFEHVTPSTSGLNKKDQQIYTIDKSSTGISKKLEEEIVKDIGRTNGDVHSSDYEGSGEEDEDEDDEMRVTQRLLNEKFGESKERADLKESIAAETSSIEIAWSHSPEPKHLSKEQEKQEEDDFKRKANQFEKIEYRTPESSDQEDDKIRENIESFSGIREYQKDEIGENLETVSGDIHGIYEQNIDDRAPKVWQEFAQEGKVWEDDAKSDILSKGNDVEVKDPYSPGISGPEYLPENHLFEDSDQNIMTQSVIFDGRSEETPRAPYHFYDDTDRILDERSLSPSSDEHNSGISSGQVSREAINLEEPHHVDSEPDEPVSSGSIGSQLPHSPYIPGSPIVFREEKSSLHIFSEENEESEKGSLKDLQIATSSTSELKISSESLKDIKQTVIDMKDTKITSIKENKDFSKSLFDQTVSITELKDKNIISEIKNEKSDLKDILDMTTSISAITSSIETEIKSLDSKMSKETNEIEDLTVNISKTVSNIASVVKSTTDLKNEITDLSTIEIEGKEKDERPSPSLITSKNEILNEMTEPKSGTSEIKFQEIMISKKDKEDLHEKFSSLNSKIEFSKEILSETKSENISTSDLKLDSLKSDIQDSIKEDILKEVTHDKTISKSKDELVENEIRKNIIESTSVTNQKTAKIPDYVDSTDLKGHSLSFSDEIDTSITEDKKKLTTDEQTKSISTEKEDKTNIDKIITPQSIYEENKTTFGSDLSKITSTTKEDPMEASQIFSSLELNRDNTSSVHEESITSGAVAAQTKSDSIKSEETSKQKECDKQKESIDPKLWDKPLGLPSPPPFSLSSICPTDILNWERPLHLPSPGLPPSEGTIKPTPKKEKIGKKTLVMNDNNRKDSKRREVKGVSPIYLELSYVPHHGNSYYSNVEFFKRVRARYYVFSGTEPSREVYNALLEAKQTWEDPSLGKYTYFNTHSKKCHISFLNIY